MRDGRLQIGVVGVGGWGRNLARNYYEIAEVDLRYMCDLDQRKLDALSAQYQSALVTNDVNDLLNDVEVDAIIVATTAPRHFDICKRALQAGKDVFVEKPLVLEVEHARELMALAKAKKRVLMVGHLLEYHPVVTRLKQMIDAGELGEIRYVYSQRLNLGTVRGDENALWNFAPHDVAVILYLLGQDVKDVSARGQSYLQKGIEDVVFMSMGFADNVMAHIHVSWLDPHKVRRLTIVGSEKMAVFDDLEANEKLRIYDKGAKTVSEYDSFAEYVGLRFGDITIPHIKFAEPLRIECQHFLDCVRNRTTPRSDGADGLRTVSVLNAIQQSMDAGGAPVVLEHEEGASIRAEGQPL